MNKIAEFRKFLAALAGAVSAIVTANVLHGQAQTYAVTASTVIGTLLVYIVPNAPAKGTVTSLTIKAEVQKAIDYIDRKYGTPNPSSTNVAPAVTVVPAAQVSVAPLPPLIPPDSPA